MFIPLSEVLVLGSCGSVQVQKPAFYLQHSNSYLPKRSNLLAECFGYKWIEAMEEAPLLSSKDAESDLSHIPLQLCHGVQAAVADDDVRKSHRFVDYEPSTTSH
ncbi:hypothetical protein NE237_029999 [Protea cynaroides]|uniref:Uncharacterized protein n=1 Tax=Protea cynaroides TaxID=273540 RepID=A0A9Q0GS82_9MAGN|nr:hypothetical protein NE237_029999 [Protea cynaroides]